MLVHALEYLIVTACALLLHAILPRRLSWVGFVVAGATFLGFVGPRDLGVALLLTAVNWAAAIGIDKWAETSRGSAVLLATIGFDVVALALYKFGYLLVPHVPALRPLFGASATGGLLVPLGISYYAFQLVGYCLEVHWGRGAVERNPGKLAASVLFFPKLVSGPIERPHHFFPQLEGAPRDRLLDLREGLARVAWGACKKAVIADRIAMMIDPVYRHPDAYAGLTLVVAIALYTVQVYTDFSGYTDIALGTARLFGVELQPNFDRPFSSKSITEFWRRWHMSLSSWTSDYVYRPLSMLISLNTRWKRAGLVFSILVTFGVLGVWHGASWSFIAFGLIHGVAVSFEAVTQKTSFLPKSLSAAWADRVRNALTVGFYALSCTFFRASTVPDALTILKRAFTHVQARAAVDFFSGSKWELILLVVGGVTMIGAKWSFSRAPAAEPRWWRVPVHAALAGVLIACGVFEATTFVYVQF